MEMSVYFAETGSMWNWRKFSDFRINWTISAGLSIEDQDMKICMISNLFDIYDVL